MRFAQLANRLGGGTRAKGPPGIAGEVACERGAHGKRVPQVRERSEGVSGLVQALRVVDVAFGNHTAVMACMGQGEALAEQLRRGAMGPRLERQLRPVEI